MSAHQQIAAEDAVISHWTEIAGFVASALVFITFSMRTIIPLRLVAISSNIAFIAYAAGAHLLPILILHTALLPINLFRTWQHLRAFRAIRRAAEQPAEASTLVPFMKRMPVAEGQVLFHRNDPAETLYFLSQGRVLLPELGKELGAGELFGEVALFSNSGRRTTSAICREAGEIMVIERARIIELCQRDASFGYYLTKLIANRMDENLTRLGKAPQGAVSPG
jgi:CRP/FNR family cyclic AMP-dependent transcriptional regulator